MIEQSRNNYSKRLRVISFMITLFAILLVTRLFILQVVNTNLYKEQANRSYISSSEQFDRGDVFLKTKDTLTVGATVTSGYVFAVNPNFVKDAEVLYEEVSAILVIDKEDFMARATKENDPYEQIADRLSKEQANLLRELSREAVVISKQRWRSYPGGSLAPQTLGFIAYTDDGLKGQYGLERVYENFLGRSDSSVQVNAFAEVFSNISSSFYKRSEEPAHLVASLDATIQKYAQTILEDVAEEYKASAARAIIINPQNGELISVVQYPTFDLNNFGAADSSSLYRNDIVENVYEFGSVVKPLVMAAGLDSSSVNPDTSFFDPGKVTIEDSEISNFDGIGRGWVTMQTALAESLNTAMIFVMQEMGKKEFKQYMTSFEIGERTGVDLPNEARGIISNLDSPRLIEYATASFGQGISTSHVALAKALSALGNGGYLVQPHLVQEIQYISGDVQEINYSKESNPRVFSGQTSKEITDMLVYNVDRVLRKGKYSKQGYSVAAKTGTAQIPNPEGGYYEDRNLHSLFGYFPAYEPEYLVLLSLEYPKNVRYASETLSDPFFNISDFIIGYAEILPDR